MGTCPTHLEEEKGYAIEMRAEPVWLRQKRNYFARFFNNLEFVEQATQFLGRQFVEPAHIE